MWTNKYKEKLEEVKVLVVGAGGIGCELLKNLVLTGFKNIHVVDLDTIDVSNLNRQFLFRREHVGKSKAEVATNAVKSLRKDANITFDMASIFDQKFGLTFFKQFNFVMNALDNKAARTHVNRMCLAGKIPLIESGSAGYLGQVTIIIKGVTECFECIPKPVQQKTFPGCTIRNTPSEHIHCTVWAKHLFNQLFGEIDIDDDVSPDMNDEENKVGGSNHSETVTNGVSNSYSSENGDTVECQPENTRIWAEKSNYDPELLAKKLFFTDINYLLKMDNLWKERRKPTPMTITDLNNISSFSAECSGADADIKQVWSPAQCAQIFIESILGLRDRKAKLPEGEILVWDKDDEEAMKFVSACANIRALIFGIPLKTAFEIKSMAGNIIPAIATTNAMVAGMVVIEALKLVTGQVEELKNAFVAIRAMPAKSQVLTDEVPRNPNPNCLACSEKHECFIRVNMNEMTLKGLKEKVLKGALNFVAPDVEEKGRVLISSEEDEEDVLQTKRLSEMKISDGSMLTCEDFLTDLVVKVYLQSSDKLKGDDFEVISDSATQGKDDMNTSVSDNRKRHISDAPPEEPDPKKSRTDINDI